jgi:hypothetical protein
MASYERVAWGRQRRRHGHGRQDAETAADSKGGHGVTGDAGVEKNRAGRLAVAVPRQTGSSDGGGEAGMVFRVTASAAEAPPKSPRTIREANHIRLVNVYVQRTYNFMNFFVYFS